MADYKKMSLFGLRIVLGWTFFWAFIDKLLGLGFATCRMEDGSIAMLCEKAWVMGASPTTGFLKFGTGGPLGSLFGKLAGIAGVVDWLFMIGLLGIGLALMLGAGMRLATAGGVLMMIFMYLAAFDPAHNPITDDHIINALGLLVLYFTNAGEAWGLSNWWKSKSFVKKYKWLE